MNKNIINPIAVAMLLLALLPGMVIGTNIKNKLVNINLQLSRPKHRSIISLMLIVILSASFLMSVVPFEARAAGGAYTLTWRAADPSSYQKYTPATLACPGDDGRYPDPLSNASSLDVVTSLAPSTLALGQIVPFEMIISVKGDTSPENGVIQFTNEFATNTSSGDNFGYDPAYKVYCAFVDTADPGTIDMGTEAKVDNFTSTLVGSGSKQYIQGTFNVSGLDDGDQVVVEIWVVLKSTIPLKSSGTVSATVDSAQTASGDKINSGHQSTDINKIGQFFTNEADVSVVKTDVPDPVIQGQTLNYTILVENHSPDTIANEIYVTDTLDTNTTFVSATGAPFTQNGNTLNFSIGFLTPGQNATLTINTIVADTAWADNDTSTNPEAGSVTLPTIYDLLNIVTETAITGDSNTTNNTYYQPTNVLSANPALKLTKEAAPLTYNAVDQTITYTYNVTNDGNVVVNGITVTDNKTAVTLDKTDLNPGESTKGTATYAILQEDINAGGVTNLAVATGKYDDNKDVTSNEATATVTAEQNADLKLTKEAAPLTYNAVDQTITYTYNVTNDGNVVVNGITVTDNKTAVTLDKTYLDPGESTKGTATYAILQEDIDAGWVTNLAVATGKYDDNKDVTSNEATATVTAEQNADLKLTKEAAPLTYNAVDQTITYTYNVTNDGNVVVNGITVTDNKTAVTLDKTYLDPGESTKGTATYSILQEDIDAGWVTNLAVATGKYDDNKDVTSNEATATVKKVAPTGQICPTQTTCEQYMSGTAADLENAAYLFNKGTIKSVSPGVMFYYSTIVPDGTVTTISVDQSNNDSWPVMATDTKQVILYDSTCRKIAVKDVKIEGSTVTLEVDNLPEGTYYLSVKYFLSSLKNYTPTDPSATVNYSFKTSLNGNLISESKDSIDLVPKK